jgi:hypothetical protein
MAKGPRWCDQERDLIRQGFVEGRARARPDDVILAGLAGCLINRSAGAIRLEARRLGILGRRVGRDSWRWGSPVRRPVVAA